MYISRYIYIHIYLLVGGTRKILVICGWHGMKHLFFFVCLFICIHLLIYCFFWDIMRYGYIWYIPSGNLTVCYGTSPSLNRWIVYITSVSKKWGLRRTSDTTIAFKYHLSINITQKKWISPLKLWGMRGAQHGATKDANTLLQPPKWQSI